MNLFFELLQVSLGTRDKLSLVPNAVEWEAMYEEADRQAMTGVPFEGLQRLMVNDKECMENHVFSFEQMEVY